jgi:hypothetical protein
MVYDIVLFLHVISATLLGIYLVLPLIWGNANNLLADAQYSYISLLHVLNRVGQFAIILSFLTGGYMIGKPEGTGLQLLISGTVLILVIGALTGIIGSRMKKMMIANKSGKLIIKEISRLKVILWINMIFVLVAIYMMVNAEQVFPMW